MSNIVDKNMIDVESRFSKTTMQRINKGDSLGTKVRLGTIDDIETFNNLIIDNIEEVFK